MGPDPHRLTADERANLVAYLDGELDESESEAIATKLIASPAARREVELLRKTWDLLDSLPRPDVPPDFTSRTLAEVSQLGRAGSWWQDRLRAGLPQAVRLLALAAASVAVLSISYAVARWGWPDPTARLERELSLAEHLDEYQAVGSFEFLRKLDDLSEPELRRLGGGPAP